MKNKKNVYSRFHVVPCGSQEVFGHISYWRENMFRPLLYHIRMHMYIGYRNLLVGSSSYFRVSKCAGLWFSLLYFTILCSFSVASDLTPVTRFIHACVITLLMRR